MRPRARMNRQVARNRRAAGVYSPCFVRAFATRARPSAVLGPVLLPPCMRQRPFCMAGPLHGQPCRVFAPQRGAAFNRASCGGFSGRMGSCGGAAGGAGVATGVAGAGRMGFRSRMAATACAPGVWPARAWPAGQGFVANRPARPGLAIKAATREIGTGASAAFTGLPGRMGSLSADGICSTVRCAGAGRMGSFGAASSLKFFGAGWWRLVGIGWGMEGMYSYAVPAPIGNWRWDGRSDAIEHLQMDA